MKSQIALCGLVLLMSCPVLQAEVSDEEVQTLREQIRLLSARLDQLENARGTESVATSANTNMAMDEQVLDEKIDQAVVSNVKEEMKSLSWAQRLRLSGDFRYRFEDISVDNGSDRNRNRLRARLLLDADVSDTLRVGFGLASGSDDPVSTNQTLGAGGSSKPINLDLAYFEWSGLADTRIVGGKFKNPLHQGGGNELLWDGDWRPEGAALSYDNGNFFAVGMGTWMESDSKNQQKELAFGAQVGLTLPVGDSAKLTAGAGYYHFDSAGKKSFYGDADFFGNSFDPGTGTYLYDYHEIEGFAEIGFDAFDRPASVFADYVENRSADDNDTGYAFGFKFGKAKGQGTWDMAYMYQKLEADAVLGLLTSSDYGGGGTDSKGSIFKGTYAIADNWLFAATYFLNKIDLASGHSRDYERLQLDLNVKFK